ncbi:hypothetical protein PInf_014708 [Phytophthora infestans]|nr:hypothetical protein PInf_014708 [Phytophthora infestans]
MQAPELEEDQAGSRSSWSDKDLEFVYRHQALRDFLHQDPVMRILNPRQIEDPREPVRAPTKTANKLVAVKDLLRLLTESGIVAGRKGSTNMGHETWRWTAAGAGGSSMIQRVRISAISDLKEFTGKDQDENRARTWISKVKSDLIRDQASDAEKCLTFADLLAGPARNWYRQLGRSTRNKWPDLLRSFQTQYCGLGVSVARQYYHARRRSDESPLEYLHRLNVAGLRAKLKIKDGGSKVLREHVDHFIETLGDVDLADKLTLLRLPDADELEEVLRAVGRAKHRQKKAAVGSGKYRQKAATPTAPARRVHQVTAPDSGAESGSDGSDSDPEDYRRVCLTASNDRTANTGDNSRSGDTVPGDRGMYRSRDLMDGTAQVRCSQCGSRKHTESGCWKHLVCEKCGKKGHPDDHCFYVCRGCGEIHDVGKCPMEKFYSQIRQ